MTGDSSTESNIGSEAQPEPLHTSGESAPGTAPAAATTGAVAPDVAEPAGQAPKHDRGPRHGNPRSTIAARVWVAIGIAVVLLVLLIIFIAENSSDITIKFLGARGTLSVALMMLISALAGVVITLLVGTARILQLRREVRRRS